MELNKTTWRRLLLLITAALLIAFALLHIDVVIRAVSAVLGVLSPVGIGICIAFIVNIPMRSLEALWNRIRPQKAGEKPRLSDRLRRPVCLILSLLLIAGLLFAVLFMLIPQLGQAFNDFSAMLPGYLAKLTALWTEAQMWLDDFGVVLPDLAIDITKLDPTGILDTVKAFFTEWGSHILDTTVSITTQVFSGVFEVVLALVFSLYMLAQKEMLLGQLHRCLSAILSEERLDRVEWLADLVNRTFTNFVTGQLPEAVIIGVLCGIGMSILRLPYALVVSVIVGFTALIPVFGAYVGTAVGAFLILLAEPVKALWFVVFIVVLQQLEGNLIYPRVVGKSVGLPGILVLAAVTVGSGLGGFPGMLLAVPVCSVIFAVCAQAVDARLAQKASAGEKMSDPAEVQHPPVMPAEEAPQTPCAPVPAAKAGTAGKKKPSKKKRK